MISYRFYLYDTLRGVYTRGGYLFFWCQHFFLSFLDLNRLLLPHCWSLVWDCSYWEVVEGHYCCLRGIFLDLRELHAESLHIRSHRFSSRFSHLEIGIEPFTPFFLLLYKVDVLDGEGGSQLLRFTKMGVLHERLYSEWPVELVPH